MIYFSIRDIHGHTPTVSEMSVEALREAVLRYGDGYEISIHGTPQELLSLGRELADMPASTEIKDSIFIPYHHELPIQLIGSHTNAAIKQFLGIEVLEKLQHYFKTYFVEDADTVYRLRLSAPGHAFAFFDVVSEDAYAYLFCIDMSDFKHFKNVFKGIKHIRKAGGANGFVYQLIVSKETESMIDHADEKINELKTYCAENNIGFNYYDGKLTAENVTDTIEVMEKRIVESVRFKFRNYAEAAPSSSIMIDTGVSPSMLELPSYYVSKSGETNKVFLDQDGIEVLLQQLKTESLKINSANCKVVCKFTMAQFKQFITLLSLSQPSSPSLASKSSPSLTNQPSPFPASPLTSSSSFSPTRQEQGSLNASSTGFASFWHSGGGGSPSPFAPFLSLGWSS